MSDLPPVRVGLSLSGGGIRAAVFHLGVLRRLARDNLLEQVSSLSTVSGGSLVTAAVFAHSGMIWPGSEQYRSDVYPRLRELITARDLLSFRALGWRGILRHNVRILSDRAGLLAEFLEEKWKIVGNLTELPDAPTWWINTTCIETGKNWRFCKREMGDWQFGRHYNPPFGIAKAAAASAAVPYGIGALTFVLPEDGWHRTDPETRQPLGRTAPPATRVRLWDGGAYENLGLEALYKPGEPLRGCDFIICSDASGPLMPPGRGPVRALLRGELWSPRLFDVTSDQIRALRSRMLARDLESGIIRGVLLKMGNSVRDIDVKLNRLRESRDYDRFLPDGESRLALNHPTDLKAPSTALFDQIARHGFEVADTVLTGRAQASFPQTRSWAD
ncbi:patatin-like phospholipase family protein [Methylobacterium oryzisoli]|uniref:patatin-like phospholipase family protein n=1 Tax=Methylobacterium oryzisoli TaxID=3385502 RepID=UPI003892A1E7